MKVLLLSHNLGAVPGFLPPGSHIGFVPTAGHVYKNPDWVKSDREQLTGLGYNLINMDIDHLSSAEFYMRLDAIDALYVTGGNTFYLKQQLHRKNIDSVLADRIREGFPYIGASAGAAILGPSLEPIAAFDDVKDAPHLTNLDGLKAISFVPLPHYDATSPVYEEVIAKHHRRYKLVPYRDDQALHVTSRISYDFVPSEPL